MAIPASLATEARGAGAPHDRWVFWGLIAVLAWIPLPLGSNRTVAIGPLVVLTWVLLAACLWQWRRFPAAAIQRLRQFVWPLSALGAFVALNWLQLVPLPPELVSWLSSETHAVHTQARALALEQAASAGLVLADGWALSSMTLSLEPHQSHLFAALGTSYFAAFVITVLTVRDRHRLDRMVFAVVLLGMAQALLAILLVSVKAKYSVLFFPIEHTDAKGTFTYRNHFAGYLEICLSVGIGLMLARLSQHAQTEKTWKQRAQQGLEFLLSDKMRLRLMLVVMVIALVLTRSRMGNAAFFVSLLIVGVLALVLMRKTAPMVVALVSSLLVVDVVVIGSWVGIEQVVDRVEGTAMLKEGGGTQESVEARTEAAREALVLVEKFPVFGTGAGTFYAAFLPYNSRPHFFFDHAHNDYVELATDFGLFGLGLLACFVVLTAAAMVRTMAVRRSGLARGVAFGVLMAIVSLAFHSLTDSNLQLPANAYTLVVVMGLGWVAYRLPRGGNAATG